MDGSYHIIHSMEIKRWLIDLDKEKKIYLSTEKEKNVSTLKELLRSLNISTQNTPKTPNQIRQKYDNLNLQRCSTITQSTAKLFGLSKGGDGELIT